MSKENLIGIVILTILFSVFVMKNGGGKNTNVITNDRVIDKIDNNKVETNENSNPNVLEVDKIRSIKEKTDEQLDIVLENEEMEAHFSKKGGCISKIILKNYKNHKDENVVLLDKTSVSNFKIIESDINTYDIDFITSKITEEEVVFKSINEKYNIVISYQLNNENKFEIKQTVKTNNNNKINFTFNNILAQQEFDIKDCKNKSAINYSENGEIKNLYFCQNDTKISKITNCEWVAFKQKFFISGICYNDKMKGELYIKDTNKGVTECNLIAEIESNNNNFELKYFFGPSKYNILKNFTNSFEKNIYLGFPIVSTFNKYIVLPFSEYIGEKTSCILIIFLLVILLKILVLPINIRIYIVTQKIKLLNKVIVILKEKYKNNQQRLAIEQINLYREFGINPLSVLLYNIVQFPFIIAIYNFIPIEMMFRHCSFLWCNDISSSDSVFNFGFNIPFYGDHISISSILMGLTMLFYLLFNDNQSEEGHNKIGLAHIFIMIFMICI